MLPWPSFGMALIIFGTFLLFRANLFFLSASQALSLFLLRCPVEYEIMGEFEYSSSKTTALVHFQVTSPCLVRIFHSQPLFEVFVSSQPQNPRSFLQAHKFPYTSSVYYQCNVRLCIRHAGGCDDVVSDMTPIEPGNGRNIIPSNEPLVRKPAMASCTK